MTNSRIPYIKKRKWNEKTTGWGVGGGWTVLLGEAAKNASRKHAYIILTPLNPIFIE